MLDCLLQAQFYHLRPVGVPALLYLRLPWRRAHAPYLHTPQGGTEVHVGNRGPWRSIAGHLAAITEQMKAGSDIAIKSILMGFYAGEINELAEEMKGLLDLTQINK